MLLGETVMKLGSSELARTLHLNLYLTLSNSIAWTMLQVW